MSAFAIAGFLLFPAFGSAVDAPFAEVTFDEACTLAAEDGKLVLLYFSETGNRQCESYRESTWADQGVREWLTKHVHAIEVNREPNADLLERFDVRQVPTVLVVSRRGTVRARVVGFRDPQALVKELETSLVASDPLALARRRLDADGDNPAAQLTYAKALVEAGRFDEALEQYVQCFDRRAEPSYGFGGIQLVVIDELGRLASRHPRALAALIERRDASRQRIMAGEARRTDPAVLAAANTQLNDLDDTLTVYETVRGSASNSLTVRLLRECAVESALKLKQYKRIAELIDIQGNVDRAHERYRRDVAKPVPPGTTDEKYRAFEQKAFVEWAVKYYEMLIGVGRVEDAENVASIFLEVDDSAGTYLALARAALRTRRPTDANARQASMALELSKKPDARTLSTLVEILLHLDRRDEAVRALDEYGPRLDNAAQLNALKELLTQTTEK